MGYQTVVPLLSASLGGQIGVALGIAALAGGVAFVARRGVMRFLKHRSPTQRVGIVRAVYAVIVVGSLALAVELLGVDGAWLLATILIAFWIGALFGVEKRPVVTLPSAVLPNIQQIRLAQQLGASASDPVAQSPGLDPTKMALLMPNDAPIIDMLAAGVQTGNVLASNPLVSASLTSEALTSAVLASEPLISDIPTVASLPNPAQLQLGEPAPLSRRPSLGKRTIKVLQI